MPRSQALACVGHLASLGSGGGGPAPRQPSAAPHGHWAWRAEAAWARTAQMSYGRGHAFSQERLQTVAHTLLSFWNAVPSSKLNPLVLAAWRPLFPVHLGPQWPHTSGCICLPWPGDQGLISSVKHLPGGRLGAHSGPQQLAQSAHTEEPNVMRWFLGPVCSQQEAAPRRGVCSPTFSGDTSHSPPGHLSGLRSAGMQLRQGQR